MRIKLLLFVFLTAVSLSCKDQKRESKDSLTQEEVTVSEKNKKRSPEENIKALNDEIEQKSKEINQLLDEL